MFRVVALAAFLAILPAAAAAKCILPSERTVVEAELLFGRDIAGQSPVSDEEWDAFAVRSLAVEFPDGFTVSDGIGNWRDPKSGAIVHEQSKIVQIVSPSSRGLAGRLRRVIEAYRTQFHQESVGVITRAVCAAF